MSTRPSLRILALALPFAAWLPSVWGASAGGTPTATSVPLSAMPQDKAMLVEMQGAFTQIAATVEPMVVNIKAERLGTDPTLGAGGIPFPLIPKTAPKGHRAPSAPSTPDASPSLPHRLEATGSGVIVRSDGYILTNDHVVEGAVNGQVTVTLSDGREFVGKVFPDHRSDLAVVKIDPGQTPLQAATFADSEAVRPGQWAIAVGSPFDLQNTMTVGIISALGRHQQINGDTPDSSRYYPDLIQTDAAINPGNSGGPLFNIDGQVVGINVAIESPVNGSAGVGFAIPSDMAQEIMASLISRGKVVRGLLGVVPDSLTPALQQAYGQKQGAFVRDLSLGSPADKAGLQAADIITSFNGQPVTGEVSLRLAIAAALPGSHVPIGYVRDGKPGIATATIAAAPPDAEDAPAAKSTAKPVLGLLVRPLTPRDRTTLTLPATTTGVLVTGAQPGSLADQIGLGAPGVAGSIVLQRINETPITSKADYDQAIATLPAGSLVTLVAIVADAQNNSLHQSAFMIQL